MPVDPPPLPTPKLILFHGKAGSGKNHHARILRDRLRSEGKSVIELAFANHLKCEVAARGLLTVAEACAQNKTYEIRTCLTQVGQERRAVNPKFFAQALLTTIELLADQGFEYFIVTDLRFQTELEGVLEVYPAAKLYSVRAPNRTHQRYMRESKGVYEAYQRISNNISETDLDQMVDGMFEIIHND